MKYALLMTALVTLLYVPAIADNFYLGLYNISFDVSAKYPLALVNYPAESKEASAGGAYTEYRMEINDTTPPTPGTWSAQRKYLIIIDRFDKTVSWNGTAYKPSGDQVIYNRTIDGKDGILVVDSFFLSNLKYYYLIYQLDPHTIVKGESSFPWDRGTLKLLNTIHIVRIENNES